MNKLDDFLKSKLENASPESPLGWEALDAALPVANNYAIAKWAFAIVILGGLITGTILLNQKSPKEYTQNQISESNPQPSVNSQSKKEEQPVYLNTNTGISTEQSSHVAVSGVEGHTPVIPSIPSHKEAQSSSDNENVAIVTPSENGNSVDVAKTDMVSTPETEKIIDEIKAKEDVSDKSAKSSKPSSVQIHKPSRKEFHNGKLYIGAAVTSIFSYRSFQLNNGAAPFINKNYDEIRQNSEATSLSYGASLTLEYKFSKNFSVQGGLSYNNIGYKANYDFEISDQAITDNSGRIISYQNISNSISVKSNNRTKIDVLRIPLGINYNLFLNPDMLFHFYVGGSQNILLSASGVGLNTVTLAEERVSKANFVKKANEICFDLGVNMALTSKIGLGIDLYYNKWLTNISTNPRENVTPFSPGVNFAISRKLL